MRFQSTVEILPHDSELSRFEMLGDFKLGFGIYEKNTQGFNPWSEITGDFNMKYV